MIVFRLYDILYPKGCGVMWFVTTMENPKVARCMKCKQAIPAEISHINSKVRYCPFCGELARGIALVSREDYEKNEI